MLIGMASACKTMAELRTKMAEKYGRIPVQYTMYLPLPEDERLALPAPRRKSPGNQIATEQPGLLPELGTAS